MLSVQRGTILKIFQCSLSRHRTILTCHGLSLIGQSFRSRVSLVIRKRLPKDLSLIGTRRTFGFPPTRSLLSCRGEAHCSAAVGVCKPCKLVCQLLILLVLALSVTFISYFSFHLPSSSHAVSCEILWALVTLLYTIIVECEHWPPLSAVRQSFCHRDQSGRSEAIHNNGVLSWKA